MGLGIHKEDSLTVYTVPLIGGQGDDGWTDNTWLTEHLRQLARKIEDSRMNIISIGTQTTNCTGAIPELVVKGFEHYVKATTKKGTEILAIDFDKLGSRSKWKLFDEGFVDVKWVCNACHKAHKTDGTMDYWDGKEPYRGGMNTVQCGMCGNVLTHRTNGGQSNPFNWTFENKK